MTQELTILTLTAASIGLFHTLLGPDHYLPFIVMARAGKWSLSKTAIVTFLCGIGHIGSSVVLGIVGVGLGVAVTKLEALESFRGNLAAWLLIAFGLVYFVWGLRRTLRNRPHEHRHAHGDGEDHVHRHVHTKGHIHIHTKESAANFTPWILFTIFVFGPCEPLIPILMYPAAKNSLFGLVLVTCVFGAVTIVTMLSVVLISSLGVNLLPVRRLERYSHALAGATICLSGLAIRFLGL
jgi:nickel/cobalt exporter